MHLMSNSDAVSSQAGNHDIERALAILTDSQDNSASYKVWCSFTATSQKLNWSQIMYVYQFNFFQWQKE